MRNKNLFKGISGSFSVWIFLAALLVSAACGSKKITAVGKEEPKGVVSAPDATKAPSAAAAGLEHPAPAVSKEAENTARPALGSEVAALPPARTGVSTPTDIIKIYERDVKNVVSRYKGKADEASINSKNDEILKKVRQFFDFSELAKLSLGNNWAAITPAQREEYNEVFRKLIERSYVSKSDKLIGDYEVKYVNEKVEGKKAEVDSSVVKEDANVDIKYMMHLKSSGWMIYNVIADNTDLVKNYYSQFNKIIGEEGYAGLIKKMKNKLKDSED